MTENTDNSLHESLSALVDGECSGPELDKLLDAIGAENSELYSAQAANAENVQTAPAQAGSLRETWRRLHTAKAVASDKNFDPQMDLSAAIAKAIANETTPQIRDVSDKEAVWFNWKPVRDLAGKTAIAASVAFAFVAGVQFINSPSNDSGQAVVAESSDQGGNTQQLPGAGVPQGFELPPLSARTVSTGEAGNIAGGSRISPIPGGNNLPAGTVVIRNADMDEYVNRLLYKHAEQSASASALGVIPFARVSDIEAADEAKIDSDAVNAGETTDGITLPNQAKSEYFGDTVEGK